MNPWTVLLLIGSFVPIPHVSAITSVTCECRKFDVKCARILGQKDRKTGITDFYPARVMMRLQEAEAHEPEVYYQQHIRQAWIIVSLLQKGVPNPFVLSSYTIYGKHPSDVWPAIVADRKARLCDEYFTWYTSDDILRPDVPTISRPSSVAASTRDDATCDGRHVTQAVVILSGHSSLTHVSDTVGKCGEPVNSEHAPIQSTDLIPHNTADADTHAANGASIDDWDIAGLVPNQKGIV